MSSPTDLAQFGQWLAERQEKLVTELWREQRQAQEMLIKGLCDVLKVQPGLGPGRITPNPVQYRLSKLTSKDDIEAFLFAFEATATAAGWRRP